MSETGKVYLVGAGPGDPGLITRRALELIEVADVIFYDRLIPAGALDGARADARLEYVGKKPNVEADRDGSTSQESINERLIEAARAGGVVVRLKGGDPFVFGRGGEEAEALAEAGIPFEVVPGVTAGVAGPAYAGIPVTHRDEAGAVAFVTGHPAREAPEDEGPAREARRALAAFPGTLVFYMGVRRLAENCAGLIEAGRDRNEPAAIIESATHPGQRVVRSTLGELADAASAAGIRAPALVVIGAVAAYTDRLAWFEPGPLAGVRVAVTRARARAGATSARLRELGAEVIELPTIRIESRLDDPAVAAAVRRLAAAQFDLLALTSANGVDNLFAALAAAGLDARALAGVEVAAIGQATAEALAERGIAADIVPPRAIAESLLEALAEGDIAGRRVLLAGAAGMRPVLAEGLTAAGAEVHHVALYETVPEPVDPDRLSAVVEADFVTIASASAARNLAAALRPSGARLEGRLVSIGPIASAAAREEGLEVAIEASEHTIDGLIAAILAEVQGG